MEPGGGGPFIEIPGFLVGPMDEDDVEQFPGVMMRIGLTSTRLTRALLCGDYPGAFTIIDENTDPDFLNDGAFQATPLNIVLGGPNGPHQKPRHLSLAKHLLVHGANANLRIPSMDLETAYESPLELLLNYYLKLIEVFGLSGSPKAKDAYRTSEETELMDCIGLNGELGGLTPQTVIRQTKELLIFCLEHGGDPNLPTTEWARTIYHMAAARIITDQDLLQRMLDIGANVNHADVHNTTPLMDIISLDDQERTLSELNRLQRNNQIVLLDNQNCSRQSALFRAAFKDQRQVVVRLLEMGANPGLCARATSPNKCTGIVNSIPPLLSPLLGNSPCTSSLIPRYKRGWRTSAPSWTVNLANQVTRTSVSPLVDSGKLTSESVTEVVIHLVTSHTHHPYVGNCKNVDTNAVIQLLFGQLTTGLRQLAVRSILQHALFNKPPKKTLANLKTLCDKKGMSLFRMMIEPSSLKAAGSGAPIAHDFILENGSELELSFGAPVVLGQDLDLREEETGRRNLFYVSQRSTSSSYNDQSSPSPNLAATEDESHSPQCAPSSLLSPATESWSNARSVADWGEEDDAKPEAPQDSTAKRAEEAYDKAAAAQAMNEFDQSKQPTTDHNTSSLSSLSEEIANSSLSSVGLTPTMYGARAKDSISTNGISGFGASHVGGKDNHSGRTRMFKSRGDDVDSEVVALNAQLNHLHYKDMLDSLDRDYSEWVTRFTDLSRRWGSDGNDSREAARLTSYRPRHSSPDSSSVMLPTTPAMSDTAAIHPVYPSHSKFTDLGGSDPGVRTEIMRDLMRVEAELAEAELRRRQQLSSSVSLTMEESTCQSPPLQAYQSPTQASQTPPLQDSSSVPSSQGHQSRSRNCIELKQINEQVDVFLDSIKNINNQTETDLVKVNKMLDSLTVECDEKKQRVASLLATASQRQQEPAVVNQTDTAARNVGDEEVVHDVLTQPKSQYGEAEKPRPAELCPPFSDDHDIAKQVVLQPLRHTVQLVKSLEVSMSAAEPRQPSPGATAAAAPRPESLHSAEDTKGEASENRKEADDVGVALLAAVESGDVENFKLHYREAFGGESPGLVDLIQKMPPPAALRADSEVEEVGRRTDEVPSLLDSDSTTDDDSVLATDDSDTWGGSFPLKHIGCRTDYEESKPSQSSIVARLTPQVVEALASELGIPRTLLPCFNLEAARLQLSLLLFNLQAVTCDRNCQGDDSEADEDDELWDTESEDSSESADADSVVLSTPSMDRSESPAGWGFRSRSPIGWAISDVPSSSSSSSPDFTTDSSSNLSIRSNFGSMAATEAGARLSPGTSAAGNPGFSDEEEDDDIYHSASSDSSGFLVPRPLQAAPLAAADTETDDSKSGGASGNGTEAELARGSRRRRQRRRSARLASSSWMEDREDLARLREFLDSSPPPDWDHSTSSESED